MTMSSLSPSFTLADFDFELPPELIAQHPAPERSASRLLDGTGAQPVDRIFRELPALLKRGDLLVFNDTKVIKARLFGRKDSGGAVEVLVERVAPSLEVLAQVRASKPPRPGSVLRLAEAFDAEVLGRGGPDGSLFRLRFPAEPFALLDAHGHVPLPPYITHADDADDVARYQTVFALEPGAVAAPTASLHFDDALLGALRERGVATRQRHAACRRRHLPAGARWQTSPSIGCTASGTKSAAATRRCDRGDTCRAAAASSPWAPRPCARSSPPHGPAPCGPPAARPTSSSRRGSSSASSTFSSRTSTCRAAR